MARHAGEVQGRVDPGGGKSFRRVDPGEDNSPKGRGQESGVSVCVVPPWDSLTSTRERAALAEPPVAGESRSEYRKKFGPSTEKLGSNTHFGAILFFFGCRKGYFLPLNNTRPFLF